MRLLLFTVLVIGVLFTACEEKPVEVVSTDNVFVMPVRKVKEGVSISEFKSARDAYVATLEAEFGTLTDREMQPFFDYTFSGLALDSIFIGFTSFQDQTTFDSIGEVTSGTDEANTFFSTFDFLAFEVLQPLNPEEIVDLSQIAVLGSEQVWEVAMRDISQYDIFEQADYESKRDAYLAVLADQNGFLREIQWKSVSNPNVVVGMTIYENAQAVTNINSDQAFLDAANATGFIQNYPPNKLGVMNTVLK